MQRAKPAVSQTADADGLLFTLEIRAVQSGGAIEWQGVNELTPAQLALLDSWNSTGYVRTGRLADGRRCVTLSDTAWERAAVLRRKKAERAAAELLTRTNRV